MAIFRKGNMFERFGEVGLFCFTANCSIKKDGSLVMGAGIAGAMKKFVPGVEFPAGKMVKEWCTKNDSRGYGLLELDFAPRQLIGIFQTKHHHHIRSNLTIIRISTNKLYEWAATHTDKIACLNYPGVGFGQLMPSEVRPTVEQLPDNVEIWSLADGNFSLANSNKEIPYIR